MSKNLPQVFFKLSSMFRTNKPTLIRVGMYFAFFIAVTVLLFFVTPGFFYDEALADILLMVIVAIIELRKTKN